MFIPAQFPLTSAQRDIWVASSLFPHLPQYNVFIRDRFTGALDVDVLAECMAAAARRNDVFRLRFGEVDGVPCQWLADEDQVTVRRVDLSGHRDPAAAVAGWMRDSFAAVYDLAAGPVHDLVLLKESETVTHAYVQAHHIISDAWGLHLFISQVRADYARRVSASAVEEFVSPSFLDAIAEDERYRRSNEYADAKAFFGEVLAKTNPVLFARKAPVGARSMARHEFTVERALISKGKEAGVSPFVLFAAAVALYLGRVHQSEEVSLGVLVLNRPGPMAKRTVGQFANALPLRVVTAPHVAAGELLAEVRGATRALLRHQRLPLSEALRELPRAGNAPQLFDTVISYLRWPSAAPTPGVRRETVAQARAHDQNALSIWIYELDDTSDLLVSIEYAQDIFDIDFPIESAAEHIVTALRALVDEPGQRLADVPLLSEAEHEALVHGRNATEAEFPADKTLPELFAEQVARTPHEVAVIGPDEDEVTFAELDARANGIAKALRDNGISPGDRVVVLSKRGIDLMVAILGTLKAGGAYVPIDPGYPAERVRFMIEDSGAKVVLLGTRVAEPEVAVPVWEIAAVQENREPVEPVAGSGDLAYVIYTSGSTGRPKGVMVEHRSVVNRLWWMQRTYPIGQSDVLLQKTSISFDVSVWELFWWTFTGARLALPPTGAERDPREILRAIERNRVTVVHFVPSMLGPFLDVLESSPGAAETLRLVVCSGEELPPARVAQFSAVLGSRARLANLYGPTEATVDVSFYDCPPGSPARVPIGRPIDNTRLYVLGAHGGPQTMGAPGELCIGGVGVARGYLGRPELTAEKFVDDPFVPGARMYRTGDLARWLADGSLEYLGRMDGQVKIRGNRVELGEVRARLAVVPGVRDAIVVARTSETHGRHLVGYYVSDAELDVRAALVTSLPEFMIPAYFVRIDEIPLSPNGKADARRLPEPVVDRAAGVAPRDAVEAELVAIIAQVLGLESVGVHDNYFALGGDSILLLRIRALAEQRGVRFALTDVLANPTVAQLAERSRSATTEFDPLVPFCTRGGRTPVFLVHPVGGQVLCYRTLAEQLALLDIPVYALQSGSEPPVSVPEMAARYVAAIKRVRPEGPYLLGGWSFGGLVAAEMARQLPDVAQVFAIDSAVSGHEVDDDVLLAYFLWELTGIERDAVTLDDVAEHAINARVFPEETAHDEVRRLFHMFTANRRALTSYRPGVIDQDVTLLRATASPQRFAQSDATYGWAEWTTGRVEVIDVPADHLTIIEEPHVGVVAKHLAELVDLVKD
ncbi:amino acid adenylation domain-containing protein [Allokutzneria sp. A3M-2-11 16]|uniref:non-ribosomal peptide synthetase n=1 Tax=Allokutzneria sp. A3M-2-11 16 TaxID=2962043 RepID=UPI0020B89643|nr:amino acid adenylation domain-containing protein [Allokutzneria sp. A3M-2-11 16]MCP3803855.1 amino acid adenylation domain-containing protein [Allokutzneria sp. A3M-2-11 16]